MALRYSLFVFLFLMSILPLFIENMSLEKSLSNEWNIEVTSILPTGLRGVWPPTNDMICATPLWVDM